MRQMLDGQHPFIAIGEVGLDYYWSREFADEQLQAFEEQVRWSVETRLPLMIHCRKAQNEMVAVMRRYQDQLPGGVFHCFTGNQQEAEAFLRFPAGPVNDGGEVFAKLLAVQMGMCVNKRHLFLRIIRSA